MTVLMMLSLALLAYIVGVNVGYNKAIFDEIDMLREQFEKLRTIKTDNENNRD